MTGETHRAGGVLCSVVGFILLKKHGLLLQDVNEVIQFAVIYPFCMWGSTASDLDHNPESCPSKDLVSKGINRTLHLTTPVYRKLDDNLNNNQKRTNVAYKSSKLLSANHRSWQTHSDLILFIFIFLLSRILNDNIGYGLSVVDTSILSLVFMGITLGIISHLILDMLTPEGIWCVFGITLNKIFRSLFKRNIKVFPEKLHIVPKAKFFATGSNWELFVRKTLKVLTVVSIIYIIGWMILPSLGYEIPYEISFSTN